MKREPEYVEGQEAWTRFQGAMHKAMSVSHEELRRRIEAEKKKAAPQPHKRGPEAAEKALFDLRIRRTELMRDHTRLLRNPIRPPGHERERDRRRQRWNRN